MEIYERLYEVFGPRDWWPGDSPFEVAVGAILTQNTSWKNVERAISNLKKKRLLNPRRLSAIEEEKLSAIIRPCGYHRLKAKRLQNFLRFFMEEYEGSMENMFEEEVEILREKLLSVNGIGPETADSILLYAGEKPVFVVDAYTHRFLYRHGLIDEDAPYGEIQDLFMRNLPPSIKLYNEFHALIVHLGKEYCRPKPKCEPCPLLHLVE